MKFEKIQFYQVTIIHDTNNYIERFGINECILQFHKVIVIYF